MNSNDKPVQVLVSDEVAYYCDEDAVESDVRLKVGVEACEGVRVVGPGFVVEEGDEEGDGNEAEEAEGEEAGVEEVHSLPTCHININDMLPILTRKYANKHLQNGLQHYPENKRRGITQHLNGQGEIELVYLY